MSTLSNREDPVEIPHCVVFHQESTLFGKKKLFSEERQYNIINCDPSTYTMEHSKFIVSNQK